MELPKNTTQIGEVHGNYKVFIEDYVISYIKQLCRQEPDRKKRIALYGVIRSEEPQQYFFIYGGAEVKRHSRSDSYLTEQDYEEITRKGEMYFGEYKPIGLFTIEDELPEVTCLFYKEREICVEGYHIFYEKNESMLAFLLQRQNQKELEKKNETHFEPAEIEAKENLCRREQTYGQKVEYGFFEKKERGKVQEPVKSGEIKLVGIVKSVAVACLIVFCVTAISAMNGMGKMEGAHIFFQKAFQAMTEKKLPDKEMDMHSEELSTEKNKNTDDNLLVKETSVKMEAETAEEVPAKDNVAEVSGVEDNVEEVSVPEESMAEVSVAEDNVAEVNRAHVVKVGDTLLGISMSYYGNENQVQAICELNGISNSDNIQVGQKIILP